MKPEDSSALALDDQLCFAVYAAAHAFGRRYKGLLAALGVTYPQYLCLLVLWRENGLSVSMVGERLQLDSGTLTPLLKRMEAMGLVTRSRSTIDERSVIISLTGKGQALREKALGIPQALSCSLGITQDEANAIKAKIDLVRKSLLTAAIEAEQ